MASHPGAIDPDLGWDLAAPFVGPNGSGVGGPVFNQWLAGASNGPALATEPPQLIGPPDWAGAVTAAGGGGAPAAPVARSGSSDSDSAGLGSLFFEGIYILPKSKVNFGNIITLVEDEYEIYSSFRGASVTEDAITINPSPGIVLPNNTPPVIVPSQSSMLDPTTTGQTTGALGTMVLLKVQALANGLPVFDDSIDFAFSAGNDVQLFVEGSRVVLIPQEYEAPVKETLAFLTDIIAGLSGIEQRIALRKQPRQLFEVVYKLTTNDRQRMQALLMDWMGNVFGFPLQHELLLTTAAVSAGATVYSVTGADDVDLRVGGLAVIITDPNTFDVINIAGKTDTTITASDPSVNAYAAGTKIMPLRTATIRNMVAGSMAQKNLETFKIVFEVTDNDTGALTGSTAAYSTFNGKVLFDDCNVMTNEMAEQYKRRVYRIDNKTGIVNYSTTWDRNKRSHQKGFVLRSRSEILDFRKAMVSIGGRQISFYIPTFNEDLEVKADLGVGTSTMDIERIEYQRFIQSREPKITFKITFTDGTNLVREVQSAAGVDSTTERLTLDTTWPATRTVDEVVRVEFYEMVRFDSDNVILQYPRIGLATSQMPVLQTFDNN